MSVLRQILEMGVEERRIARNPCSGVKAPRRSTGQIGQEARKRDNAEGAVAPVVADARAAGDSWQLIADALDLPTDKVQGRCDEAHYDDQ